MKTGDETMKAESTTGDETAKTQKQVVIYKEVKHSALDFSMHAAPPYQIAVNRNML